MIIKNKDLRKKMNSYGLNNFELAKDPRNHYFYVTTNKNATSEEEFMALNAKSICLCEFEDYSIDEWSNLIDITIKESRKNHSEWFNRKK